MSLFKTFQKDRKIDTTPFDLSFQNILTCNFGGLTPLANYPVLPKDRFKVGSNILTKVEPMPAPAFCRIKQNTYAFFTPNSTVWKHWNDYVTNGTAYADTYGNNTNNQQTDNQWRPPQVAVNDLQLISKIANGWCIPVFRLTQAYTAALIRSLYSACTTEYQSILQNLANPNSATECGADVGNVFFSMLLTFAKASANGGVVNALVELFEDIPYYECGFTRVSSSAHSMIEWAWHIDYGCDLVTSIRLIEILNNIQDGGSPLPSVGTSTEPSKTITKTSAFELVRLRPFSDNSSNDVKLSHSPFSLVKKTYTSDSFTASRPINYYVYKKNKYIDTIERRPFSSGTTNPSLYKCDTLNVRNCGSFWNMFTHITASGNGLNVNGYQISVPTTVTLDYAALRELFITSDFMLDLHIFRTGTYYNDLFYNSNLGVNMAWSSVSSSDIELVGSYHQLTDGVHTDYGWGYPFFNPFVMSGLIDYNNETPWRSLDGLSVNKNNLSMEWLNWFDIDLPIFCDNFKLPVYGDLTTLNRTFGKPLFDIPFTFESYNLGYDSFSFLIYLCKNSCKLMDYYNIPLEGFTARSWDMYVGEFLNMLPFFGYSKIWNDYFRNKTVSTAELDYSETNSIACLSEIDCGYMYSHISKLPRWLQDSAGGDPGDMMECMNGWCLPFSCAPKNSFKESTIVLNDKAVRLADLNHFHDLRVRNHWTLLSVLTGWQLHSVTLNSIISAYDVDTFDLYGILAEKFYLPSYYNGLLHYKYQNFNKDYFSSALLDPAAGANDEQIGSTVSSLVTAQAKQGFWNRLANNRSVKQFWNSVFGVDPSHDEYDKPLLLGSAHTDVNVGEVVQLSQTDTTPQGQRSGLGSAHDKHGLCNKQFNEHGYVVVLCSHTLELQYMQGLEKDWTPLESFLDLPFIDFVGLGNQSINQRELNYTVNPRTYRGTNQTLKLHDWYSDTAEYIYIDNNFSHEKNKINYIYPSSPHLVAERIPDTPLNSNFVESKLDTSLANGSGFNLSDIFGYIPRYSTWKFKFDQCHGEFRDTLDFWHAFRRFFTQPILCHEFVNWEFMAENDELGRMFFVQDDSTDKFKLDCFINCTAYRPLPYVCVPSTSKS